MQISTRRTQPVHPRGLKGDDGNTQRAGAAGGADATPASLCRRFKAGERPQAIRAASSPPREAPGPLLDGGEATTAEIEAGGGAWGFEVAAALGYAGRAKGKRRGRGGVL
jgi:hypothetical protein